MGKVLPCWLALVLGTSGVGFCLWLGALHFVQEINAGPFEHLHIFYSPAGICQVVAGAAMIWANRTIRAYFQDPRSNRWKRPAPRAQQLSLASASGSLFLVQVPVGVVAGQQLQATTPNGVPVLVTVPEGVAGGDSFQVV